MNCDYILQNDMYERYLLNQLDAEDKAKFEVHLKECLNCQSRLEDEKRLIQGLKMAGRGEMKKEIRRQVEEIHQASQKSDWTIAFKVAAVMFFLVLMPGMIFMLNDYFRFSPLPWSDQTPSPKDDVFSRKEFSESEIQGIVGPSKKDTLPTLDMESMAAGTKEEAKSLSAARELSSNESTGLAGGSVASTEIPGEATPRAEALKEEEKSVATREGEQTSENLERQVDVQGIHGVISLPELHEKNGLGSKGAISRAGKIDLLGSSTDEDTQNVQTYRLMRLMPAVPGDEEHRTDRNEYTQTQVTQILNFTSGKYQIMVQNQMPYPKVREDQKTSFPDSFSVSILSRNDQMINMEWYPEFDINDYLPDQITVRIIENQQMQLFFGNEKIYLIDLNDPKQRAIRQK